MTTINPNEDWFREAESGLGRDDSHEAAAGLPDGLSGALSPVLSAGIPTESELARLANSLFPDLTQSITDAESASSAGPDIARPEVSAAGAPAEIPETGAFDWENPLKYDAQAAQAAQSAWSAASAQPAGAFDPRQSKIYNFESAGSGGEWLNTLRAALPPEAEFIPEFNGAGAGRSEPTRYSPQVLSREEAREAARVIDVPTSQAGGEYQTKPAEKPTSATRDDSIRIGSKTLAQIRADFPILSEQINGNRLVWLDNGATTQRPRQVIDRLSYYYEHENSNVHRGAHTLAARSTDAYEKARETVRGFIGAPSAEEIVFVRGTTEGINLVAGAVVKPLLSPGDEIIVSILEHHANIVPWQLIARETGAVIKVIPCDETGQLRLDEYVRLFSKRTRFVSVTHVSNGLGTVTPIEELIQIAHRFGVPILIDGAQSVAHIPVNVSALDADFFVFSGHKIFAPTGIGALYGKKELLEAAQPYHGGGNMIADVTFERTVYNGIPNKFEAGTGSIADAVGLGAALEYLSAIGMPHIYQWEHELLQYAMAEMKKVKGLHLVGTALNKASVLAFKLDGYSDEEVGKRLDRYGVAVRTGHHCAQPVLRHFGLESTVRPTIALYNSPDDIDTLVRVLRSFA